MKNIRLSFETQIEDGFLINPGKKYAIDFQVRTDDHELATKIWKNIRQYKKLNREGE